jgi:predicted outer membrane protein
VIGNSKQQVAVKTVETEKVETEKVETEKVETEKVETEKEQVLTADQQARREQVEKLGAVYQPEYDELGKRAFSNLLNRLEDERSK